METITYTVRLHLTMPKIKVTVHAKHLDRTQQFLDAIQAALETFEDEISSLTEDIHSKAYKNYVTAYREALVPVWNLARFANIRTVMKTVADKELKEITTMAARLKPASPSPKVVPPKSKIPDLETSTDAMLRKFPGKSLPKLSICEKIGDVFSNLSMAQAAYAEAARGLAELDSTHSTTVHVATDHDSNSSHPASRPRPNDFASIQTTSTPARIQYCCGTFRNHEVHKNASSSGS